MNFPPDVISKAVLISEELRQKQLPEKQPNLSNLMHNNSSGYKRSTYRSTVLETSTSEHTHLLRLFYNLYADIVAISRMDIGIDEKHELLNKKMKELTEDLPSHVIEMARKGNLFDMFKRSMNVPVNSWTPPKQAPIVEESLRIDDSQLLTSHDETNFSLLSDHSVARRIGMELQNMNTPASPPTQQSHSKKQTPLVQQQSDVELFSNYKKNRTVSFEDSFPKNRFSGRSGRDSADSSYNVDDSDFDADNDFMDLQLTQYFSNLSPKDDDLNLQSQQRDIDFLFPDLFENNKKLTGTTTGGLSGKPRSHQNTSTEAQAPVSSKDYLEPKSSSMNNSHRASSSTSSSSLFRLQLKVPLKVKDNRILKTPPKAAKRIPKPPLEEFTFSNIKDTTEQRSTTQLSCSLFNDEDFSSVDIPSIPSSGKHDDFSNIEIPSILSRKSKTTSESPSKSFHLNLTQFCAREGNEEGFFNSTQDIMPMDGSQLFTNLSQGITPFVPSSRTFRESFDAIDQSFAIADISSSTTKSVSFQYRQSSASVYSSSNKPFQQDASTASTSQEKSGNFFNLNRTKNSSKSSKGPTTYKSNPKSYIPNVTIAPKVKPPSALQFIQQAYQNESDNDTTDDEELQDKIVQPSASKKETMKLVAYSSDPDEGIRSQADLGPHKDKKFGRKSGTRTDKRKLLTEPLNTSTASIRLVASDENLENIVLPVPPQFL